MHGFEGYVGIRLWEGQMINDLLFAMLLGQLVIFSVVFRANHRLFSKMIRDMAQVKDRLSLFEEVSGNETIFRNFMTLQSLFLCSISIFLISRNEGYIIYYPDLTDCLKLIALIFIILFTFYLLKQAMYIAVGSVFATPDQYRIWRTGYSAATGLWGVSLYIPVLWISFIGSHERIAAIMFAALFIAWRLSIIYKSIRIFNIKSIGILYISLYLCALEILPLLFLFEGIKYLYNFIDELALWY
jgi:hypothetical protein